MYCKLCGEHLYKDITVNNIFKLRYNIHHNCELKLNKFENYLTYPLLDKLVLHDYLFEDKYENSDSGFLDEEYSYLMYNRLLNNREWSIVIFVSKRIENDTLILITKLADNAILFCSVFNENFF